MFEHRWFLSDVGRRQVMMIIKSVADSVSGLSNLLSGAGALNTDRESRLFIGEPVDGTYLSYRVGNVGLLDISGVLTTEHYGVATNEFLAFDENPDVPTTVLRLDTPGGMVTGLSGFGEVIAQAKNRVIAHPVGSAASAGYYIASQASEIIAVDSSDQGCLGTVLSYMDFSGAFEMLGIKQHELVSTQTPRKRTDMTTEEGQQDWQNLIDADAELFINAVATGRGVTPETVQADFGQGAMFIAGEALKRGMIDKIQSTRSLLAELQDVGNSNFKAASVSAAKRTEQEMSKEEIAALKKKAAESQAQAVKEALDNERARVSAIDAIAASYAQDDGVVISAVQAVVDEGRVDPNATAETIQVTAAQAAVTAMRELTAGKTKASDKLADDLSGVSDPEEGNEQKEQKRKSQIDGMVSGMKAQGSGVN
jgi:ClpP class serine protease